jgi:hypothetical protein
MRKPLMIGVAIAVFWTSIATAQTANDDGKLPYGGALCAWSVLAIMKTMGEYCFANEKTEFKAALGESVEKLTALILERSPEFRSRLEKKIVRYRSEIKKRPDGACFHAHPDDLFSTYRLTERFGVDKLRESISPLLASSSKPTANSCLSE